MKLIYLNTSDIILIHEYILKKYWWLHWIKDFGQLDSILHHIQNDLYYPTVLEKICHLFFWIIKFHCFFDWNKRTAIMSLNTFLELNSFIIEDIIIKLEDIAVWVAENQINKEELMKIFKSMFLSFWYKI